MVPASSLQTLSLPTTTATKPPQSLQDISYPSLPALYYGKPWELPSSLPSPERSDRDVSTANETTPTATSNNEEALAATVTVHLQHFDFDWCDVIGKVLNDDGNGNNERNFPNPVREPPTISRESAGEGQNHQDEEPLPIALLIHDGHGRKSIQNRPCHLIDYENLAIAWNISYIIFYDTIDQPLTYENGLLYLDSPILSNNYDIGFQLVSHQTGEGM